jgi:hypothetical protein
LIDPERYLRGETSMLLAADAFDEPFDVSPKIDRAGYHC